VTRSSLIEQLTAEAARDGIQQLVVRAVITQDRSVLLLRRAADDFMGGNWELPGGKVDPGETLDQALVREAREETGLDITAVTEYLGSLDYTSRSGGRIRQFNFAADVTAYEPVILTEHDRYQWSPVNGHPPVGAPAPVIVDVGSG
jgi:8-oxo-dGTP diphosphatase